MRQYFNEISILRAKKEKKELFTEYLFKLHSYYQKNEKGNLTG